MLWPFPTGRGVDKHEKCKTESQTASKNRKDIMSLQRQRSRLPKFPLRMEGWAFLAVQDQRTD